MYFKDWRVTVLSDIRRCRKVLEAPLGLPGWSRSQVQEHPAGAVLGHGADGGEARGAAAEVPHHAGGQAGLRRVVLPDAAEAAVRSPI